ncbi:MAG: undecaprenyl-phosphate glucose phosphotransferase [Cytophagaceae bacterium]|nr:undecaprenyl-phosphate glucose phosphotransferase [Cytophagaceae bacterium]
MRRAHFIIPISVFIHLVIINTTLYLLTPETYVNLFSILYINLSWLITAYALNYYPTARKEKFLTNIHKVIQLYVIFGLAYFALFGFRQLPTPNLEDQFYIYGTICAGLMIYRILFYFARERYRSRGGNFVSVVVVGRDKNLKKIRRIFDEPELGYRYKGYFDNNNSYSPTYLGPITQFYEYIKEGEVDEIYCMVSRLTKDEIRELIHFADNNFKKIKIIPDNKEIYSRGMSLELYDTIPVLNLRKLPLDTDYAKFTKRFFDLVFSFLVILFILSWLTPLMYILIKAESKGPLFFRQKRHGFNKQPFWCYKFRSMKDNKEANTKMMVKGDKRVTKIGAFLRKTSLDELPQFFNVFLGDMSVVGPRPHMESQSDHYIASIDKYLVRHYVKPGITGLAQIRGFRGEIVEHSDIINRTKLDVFYVEKWSLRLDLSIIYYTVVNVLRGEDKAY